MQSYLIINKRMGDISKSGALDSLKKKNKNIHGRISFRSLYVTTEILLMKIESHQYFIIYISLF